MRTFPSTVEVLQGHDFGRDPEEAVRSALFDVATKGMGALDNAFEEASLHGMVDDIFNPSYLHSRVQFVGDQLTTNSTIPRTFALLVDEVKKFTTVPPSTYAFVKRNTSEVDSWHPDGSLQFPGLRFLAHISGNRGALLATKTNAGAHSLHSELAEDSLQKGRELYAATYEEGRLLVLAQSMLSPIMAVVNEQEAVPIEHPVHAGVGASPQDSRRTLLLFDIQLRPYAGLKDLGLQDASQVREAKLF